MQTGEITKEQIVEVRNALKVLTNKWARRIAKKMFPEMDEAQGLDKIYNIVSGVVRDQETRRLFVTTAGDLKKELEADQDKAAGALKEITK